MRHKGMNGYPGGWWSKLDNAAKIYPAIAGRELSGVFRLSVTLSECIRLPSLRRAVSETSALFPVFGVELCKGLFWYYLENTDREPRVMADRGPRCSPFPVSVKGELLYRVLARDNVLSVEFFHILTDGSGGLFFLKALLNRYLLYAFNITVPPFPEAEGGQPEGSGEDLFLKYYRKGMPVPPVLPPAWHLPGSRDKSRGFHATELQLPASSVKNIAQENGCTVTVYLVTSLLMALQSVRNERSEGSPFLRVQVPVDLRRRYGSVTLRNFSLFAVPGIDIRQGTFSFSEIMSVVNLSLQSMNSDKTIAGIIARNVSKEKNPLIRIMPLFIKSQALRAAYNRFGTSQFTTTMTNLGKLSPEGPAAEMITAFSITPPPPHERVKVSCGVASTGDNMIITFGSVIPGRDLERTFVRNLTSAGLPVKLLTGKI